METTVSDEFKAMCKSNTPSGAIGRIKVIEDDIEIKESTDIQNIEIEDNCYVNDKFIGTTVAKKVTVNLFNDDNVYDLEDKEVEVKLGFQHYDPEQVYEGKNIDINNAKPIKPQIDVHGESTQKTRSGKNLLNLLKCSFSRCTLNSDNKSLTCNINDYYFASIYTSSLNNWLLENKGKTITFSTGTPLNKNTSIVINGTRSDGSTYQEENENSTGKCSITIADDFTAITSIELRFNRQNTPFTDTTTVINYAMLELGAVATEYEPYGASPSPDYPSEIENIEGKNKFDKASDAGYREACSKTINGEDIVITSSIKTLTKSIFYWFFYVPEAIYDNALSVKLNTDYTLSYYITNKVNSLFILNIFGVSSNNSVTKIAQSSSVNQKVSIAFNSGNYDKIAFVIYPFGYSTTETIANNSSITISDMQLEEGTVATPYVPYNSLEFKVEGKNLFDYEQFILEANAIESGKAERTTYLNKKCLKYRNNIEALRFMKGKFHENTQYTFKTSVARSGYVSEGIMAPIMYIRYTDGTDSYVSCVSTQNSFTDLTFTSKANKTIDYIYVPNYSNSQFVNLNLEITQLEQGSTATDYEPYKSQVETFPLAEGQKLMEGSYLASDGIHHKRRQIVLNGTESITNVYVNTSTTRFGFSLSLTPDKKIGLDNVLSTHFKCDTTVYYDSQTQVGICGNDRNVNIYIRVNGNITTDEFKTWLATQYANGTPVIVEYELAEPETVPYTAEQQEAWDKIESMKLYDGVNHISSDANLTVTLGKEETSYGNFIIEKPNTEEVQAKTNFTGYDYMIKFNVPFVDNNTYPVELGTYFSNLCTQVGLVAGNTDFINSDYLVKGNPFTNNEDCKTVLSAIAQIASGIAKIGRDNKVYIINLSKEDALHEIDGNNYDTFTPNKVFGPVNKVILKMNSEVNGEESVRSDEESISQNGECAITISDNPILTSQEERELVIDNIFNAIKGITYLPFKTTYYGYPYADSTDKTKISNVNDTEYNSYIFNHTISYDGSFSGSIETSALTKIQSMYKNTLDLKSRFRRTELAVDKINGKITSIIEQQEGTQSQINAITQDVNSTTAKIEDIENETNSKIDELKHTVDGVINQFSENGGNNLFYYDKEYWQGGDVTTTTTRNIQLGDDLSGKKLVFSFPEGVNLGEELIADIIVGATGYSISIQQITDTSTGNFLNDIIIKQNGTQSRIYRYDVTNSEIINNYTEYTLSEEFGEVTELNTDISAYSYIKIEESTTEQVLNIEEYINTEFVNNSKSGYGYIVNSGSSKQSVEVQNGTYTVSFKYKKIGPELSSASVKINGEEYPLAETDWSNFKQTIEVTANYIEVEFISDTDNALYVADLLGNIGTEQEVWTQNPNETRTDTVTIGKGISVKSTTTNTELKADSDGVRINNTQTNKTVAEFTDKGTETEELVVRGQAEISGLLIQQVGNQTWISSLL